MDSHGSSPFSAAEVPRVKQAKEQGDLTVGRGIRIGIDFRELGRSAMRTLIVALFMILALTAATAAPAPAVAQFDSEEKAHIHCPMDKVVWVNPRTRLWYMQQSKHYA